MRVNNQVGIVGWNGVLCRFDGIMDASACCHHRPSKPGPKG